MTFMAVCSGWVTGLYNIFFGVYLEDEGISPAVSGILWILLGLLSFFGGVFWGTISDRIGRRQGFFLSFVVLGVGSLLFWITPFWITPALMGFTVAVVLAGMSFRACFIICAASMGDYVAPNFAAAAFGLTSVGAGLGHGAGAPIAGRIADSTGTLVLFLSSRLGPVLWGP